MSPVVNRSQPYMSAGKWSVDDEVHVWHYVLDVNTERKAGLKRMLNDEELDQAARYRFEKHRRRFIASRGTLRIIIARYLDCEPHRLHIGYGKHGKPYIVSENSVQNIRFNATNSHGLGAIAISRRSELGLDLEKVCSNDDYELVASRVFSTEEREWLIRLPEEERLSAFFELWTCKEAYLKGKGFGLAVPPNHFSVSMDPEKEPRLSWSAIDDNDPQRWLFKKLSIEPGFVACLAVECGRCTVRSARWPA